MMFGIDGSIGNGDEWDLICIVCCVIDVGINIIDMVDCYL